MLPRLATFPVNIESSVFFVHPTGRAGSVFTKFPEVY